MPTYAIRGGEEGARRLDLLAQVMAPTTDALLDAAGVAAGMSCLDVGCGAGHVSRRLAARVGPSGHVVGLDVDVVKLASAGRESQRAGLENIEFRLTDVTTWAERAAYDIVYGRFIVSHLAERSALINRLCTALRGQGVLILEDIDFTGCFCHPPSPAFDRYCELYTQLIGRRGGDANVGAQLYQLCLDARLEDVNVQVVQPTHGGRVPGKDLTLSTLVNIADAVMTEALATPQHLGEIIAELTEYTEDPRSIVACPRIFQVWGRRPG
jgi:2-polyprenyl-3-methyl-5-hydroxy-6-metoxy-1,4-benzoquinol methylase